MYSDYLVNNKLYLKEEISIQCAKYNKRFGSWSKKHEWVKLKEHIDIFSLNDNEFVFTKSNEHYIYWCDISIFVKLRCKSKSELRDESIDKILNGLQTNT